MTQKHIMDFLNKRNSKSVVHSSSYLTSILKNQFFKNKSLKMYNSIHYVQDTILSSLCIKLFNADSICISDPKK